RAFDLHHHLLEPGLHAGACQLPLPVAPVAALDAAGDAGPGGGLAAVLVWPAFRPRRLLQRETFARWSSLQGKLDPRGSQLRPGCIEAEAAMLREAVHQPAIPRVGIEPEGILDEAAAADAAARIRDQQLRQDQLVHTEAAAGDASALGVVEHEEVAAQI